MKQSFLKIIFLLGFFTSCKETIKQDSNLSKFDTTLQNKKTLKLEISDTATTVTDIGFMKPKKVEVTDNIKRCAKEKIESVEEIDFTGDKIPDFICKAKLDKLGIGNEYWISSEYKIIKITKYYSDGFYYRWFINLDNDPEPEIYEAIGDEDGADYIITDQNLLIGKDTTLLYINPVIVENDKKYWGYPWDISNIRVMTSGKNIELFCSLNHKIVRDGNEENNTKFQKQMPVIFFTGHHTQESGQHNIKNEQWLTLKEIIRQTKR
jgi:hypothetical protein